jgi:bifunctional DNA primase/polymerase-like protein
VSITRFLDCPLPRRDEGGVGLWWPARWYGVFGLPIFPGDPGGKLPNTQQITERYRTNEIGTTDVGQIDLWWGVDKWSNPLVPMGAGPGASGLVGFDYDYRNGLCPVTRMRQRCAELGVEKPRGVKVRTPSGEHEYFPMPEGVGHFPKVGGYIPGAVDVIATGGYLNLPPARLYVPGDTEGVSESGKATVARERATWKTYRWVKPGTPDPVDVYPDTGEYSPGQFGYERVGQPALEPWPPLAPEDEWFPTMRELWEALGAAELPPELVEDILTPRESSGGSGADGLTPGGLPHFDGGVPVDAWLADGLPPDLNHEGCLVQMSNALARRGWTFTEIVSALEHVTDPAVTPLKAERPWDKALLQYKARRSIEWVGEQTKAEIARNQQYTERWS